VVLLTVWSRRGVDPLGARLVLAGPCPRRSV